MMLNIKKKNMISRLLILAKIEKEYKINNHHNNCIKFIFNANKNKQILRYKKFICDFSKR
jgi:hypothetical protein